MQSPEKQLRIWTLEFKKNRFANIGSKTKSRPNFALAEVQQHILVDGSQDYHCHCSYSLLLLLWCANWRGNAIKKQGRLKRKRVSELHRWSEALAGCKPTPACEAAHADAAWEKSGSVTALAKRAGCEWWGCCGGPIRYSVYNSQGADNRCSRRSLLRLP